MALWGLSLLLAHPSLYERDSGFWWGWGVLCIMGCYSLFSVKNIRGRLRLLHLAVMNQRIFTKETILDIIREHNSQDSGYTDEYVRYGEGESYEYKQLEVGEAVVQADGELRRREIVWVIRRSCVHAAAVRSIGHGHSAHTRRRLRWRDLFGQHAHGGVRVESPIDKYDVARGEAPPAKLTQSAARGSSKPMFYLTLS